MATIDPSITDYPGTRYARGVFKIQWVGKSGDTFVAADCSDFADRSVQIAGTFGDATVSVKGSNDGSNYLSLRNALTGNVIEKTSAAIELIAELSALIKPEVSGTTGANIIITILARKAA
jgi:hypothetical protein